MTIKRSEHTPIFHRAVAHNEVLYLPGVTAGDPKGDMEEQTLTSLEKIDRLLQANGSDKSHVLHATIYIIDMSQKDMMNSAWLAYFDDTELPSRATLGVADLGPGILIEIVVQAAIRK